MVNTKILGVENRRLTVKTIETIADYKKILGGRIRQARNMAGYDRISDLSEQFPEWSESRLGNYENGTSIPNPLDIMKIANQTDTSPCWIMFGLGSIRSAARDIQAVRYQNLTNIHDKLTKSEQVALRIALKLKPTEINNHLKNPFLKLTSTLCRKIEQHLKKEKGWMDEQHIDNDGLCDFFPDDLREVMTIYSDLDQSGKAMFTEMARAFKNHYPK